MYNLDLVLSILSVIENASNMQMDANNIINIASTDITCF